LSGADRQQKCQVRKKKKDIPQEEVVKTLWFFPMDEKSQNHKPLRTKKSLPEFLASASQQIDNICPEADVTDSVMRKKTVYLRGGNWVIPSSDTDNKSIRKTKRSTRTSKKNNLQTKQRLRDKPRGSAGGLRHIWREVWERKKKGGSDQRTMALDKGREKKGGNPKRGQATLLWGRDLLRDKKGGNRKRFKCAKTKTENNKRPGRTLATDLKKKKKNFVGVKIKDRR